MADKRKLDIFGSTSGGERTPGDLSDLEEGHVRPIGLGLREGEIAALDAIAGEHGISRGGTMRIALRLFIKAYRAGEVDLAPYVSEPQPRKNKIILPK